MPRARTDICAKAGKTLRDPPAGHRTPRGPACLGAVAGGLLLERKVNSRDQAGGKPPLLPAHGRAGKPCIHPAAGQDRHAPRAQGKGQYTTDWGAGWAASRFPRLPPERAATPGSLHTPGAEGQQEARGPHGPRRCSLPLSPSTAAWLWALPPPPGSSRAEGPEAEQKGPRGRSPALPGTAYAIQT